MNYLDIWTTMLFNIVVIVTLIGGLFSLVAITAWKLAEHFFGGDEDEHH